MNTSISSSIPDWNREKCRQLWDPPRRLLRSIRKYQKFNSRKGLICQIIKKKYVLSYRFWSIVTGADIPLDCTIGGGLLLVHPNGIVINPGSVIGPNCLILQQVTIVDNVTIGGHVDLSAGAKIIKPVKIGDHSVIGANAVVTTDIPSGAVAVGVPARVLSKDA